MENKSRYNAIGESALNYSPNKIQQNSYELSTLLSKYYPDIEMY